ncbi:uncharacterized protein LOC114245835 [Bombyx mandarina]|uniref:Uncharacterized protein LOC114245835 n=1 Tax=Bombyx mandarina TaxID=7092 RepID=A0A6J2JWY5_BOMMA|nr:uncharacterized protein LOC114245835 [Bombyx mandarina]
MSSFSVCVLVLCVLCVIAESRVIKTKEFPLPPEGLTVEISIRTKSASHPISTVKVDIDEQSKKVTVSKIHHRLKGRKVRKHKAKTEATILENRGGFPQGNCPDMWEWNSGMCIPIADYE